MIFGTYNETKVRVVLAQGPSQVMVPVRTSSEADFSLHFS